MLKFYARDAKVKTEISDVQMITGAIRAILTPYSIAVAKAIAPDGPAAFRISNCDQCVDHSPDNISNATSAGKPNNLIAETRQIVFHGAKLCADKITLRANRVIAAVPALKNSKAVFTGPIRGGSDKLNNTPKTIHNKMGFLTSRFTVLLSFADLWNRISVEITKKARVIDASHAIIATIGTLPVGP